MEDKIQQRETERDPEMEDEIQHFIHEHPLIFHEVDPGECLVCRNEIPLWSCAYSCREHFCFPSYNIHIRCAKLQREMVHPFHPKHSLTFQMTSSNDVSSSSVVSFKCDACGPIPRSSNYFHCSDCGFNLDPCCALLKHTETRNVQDRQIQTQIQSLLRHPHPLIICENKTIFNFPCSACRQPINGSWICVCLECNCLLDESCAQWPSQIDHPLHPQHPLTLLVHHHFDSASNRCSACGKVLVGFTFHCSDCNFSLDPCCASLIPLPSQNSQGRARGREEEEEFQIQQLSHPHPLIPCEMTKKGYAITCDACQLLFEEDSSVVYVCLECKFLLHKSCADLPLKVKHSFCHQQHALTLLPYSIRQSEDPFVKEKPYTSSISSGKAHEFKGKLECHACTKYASGFAYVCRNPKCGIFFDIRCPVSKPWFIKSEIHHHPLPFFNDRPPWLYCTVCNRIINITPFFRCVECEFNLHPYCVPKLPPTAKDKIHRHPLTLTNSPIRDYPDEHEHSEFYCDTCEEMRYLEEPTYYCEECHYVAHVHCLLAEIFPMLGAYKFGETKLDMSTSSKALTIEEMVEEEEGVDEQEVDMATGSSRKAFPSVSTDNSSMVASKKMLGARFDGDSFLIELDKEIVELRSKAEWLAKKLKATREKNKTSRGEEC
ncbi:unnamed protein product [Camellia sinensis]